MLIHFPSGDPRGKCYITTKGVHDSHYQVKVSSPVDDAMSQGSIWISDEHSRPDLRRDSLWGIEPVTRCEGYMPHVISITNRGKWAHCANGHTQSNCGRDAGAICELFNYIKSAAMVSPALFGQMPFFEVFPPGMFLLVANKCFICHTGSQASW